MSDFDVKEKRFEEDIEDYLIHHGGYIKGDPKKFNRESGLDEMAAALVESFINHLSSRDDLEKAAVTVAEGIKDYSTGKRGR